MELANRDVASWLAALESDYLPGALARGMTRAGLWTRHSGRDTTIVHILWTLPGSAAFFRMRGAAAADPAVTGFWAATDALARTRTREVYGDAGTRAATDAPARARDDRNLAGTAPVPAGAAVPVGSTATGVEAAGRGGGERAAGGAGDDPGPTRRGPGGPGEPRRHVILLPGSGDALPGGLAAYAEKSGAAAGAVLSVAGPDLPGTVGGTGASWDVTGPLPDGLPPGAHAVTLTRVAERRVALTRPRIKRTLLLTVRQDAPADSVSRLETDLMAMPAHIPQIRSWSLARVDQELTPSPWTHVWEQEFATLEDLTGPYLRHPYHWTHVDAWFDHEVPGAIVEPRLAHVFRWSPVGIIGVG